MKQKPTIIAVLNQKGGVGKTTTAINLASAMGKLKKTVCVVDADPQGNATSGLGVEKMQLEQTLYDVIVSGVDVKNVLQKTKIKNVILIPSNASLASAEIDISQIEKREEILKNAIDSLGDVDFVLIDCPPSLGLLTVNALTAADFVLIPVQSEYYALEGLSQLLQVMRYVQGNYNQDLELLGVVLTMYDKRNSLSRQVTLELEKHFNEKLFKTRIPRNIRLAEAPSYGLPIDEYDKWSKGSKSYRQLADEVLKRVNGPNSRKVTS